MSDPAKTPSSPRRLYFVGPVTDFALIGGGSLVLFALLSLFDYRGRTPVIWTTAAWLQWVVNWPHFSSTSYRLYHSKANIAQYPVTAIGIPFLVLAGVAFSFMHPDTVAPYFVKLFMLWSPYHFCAQSLGICLLYARRAGYMMGGIERLALSGFTLGIYLSAQARGEAGIGPQSYYSMQIPSLGVPTWVPAIFESWMYLCGGAFLVFAAAWSIRNRRLVPPIVLLPAITQYVWFIPGGRVESFNEFVPFFHSLQYLLLAWSLQLKERLDASGADPSPGFVGRETLVWGAMNIIGGATLFWGIPRALELVGYGPAGGFPAGWAEAVFISGVQLHHFFVDGVIWKIRNPKVASPLSVNIEEFLRPATVPSPAPGAAAGGP